MRTFRAFRVRECAQSVRPLCMRLILVRTVRVPSVRLYDTIRAAGAHLPLAVRGVLSVYVLSLLAVCAVGEPHVRICTE